MELVKRAPVRVSTWRMALLLDTARLSLPTPTRVSERRTSTAGLCVRVYVCVCARVCRAFAGHKAPGMHASTRYTRRPA